VFFGVRSYLENVGGGTLTLGSGLAVGLLITLIPTVFSVATWEVLYFKFMPDFGDKFAGYMWRRPGPTAPARRHPRQRREAHEFKAMYDGRGAEEEALSLTRRLSTTCKTA
jgi:hypothetical protein